MTQEEKIKEAKMLYESANADQRYVLESLFPELKESEGERIWIINYLSNRILNSTIIAEKENLKKAIAWLEKQGEQKSFARYKVGDTIYYNSFGRLVSFTIANIVEDGTNNPMYEDKDGNSVFQNDIVEPKPTDKVEPKFKKGDWVVNKFGDVWHIDSFDKKNYQVSNGDKYNYFPISKQNEMHLWTIQDAKDGDVLAVTMYPEGTWIGILKEYNGCTFSSYCFVNTEGTFKLGTYNHGNGKAIHPATKEQRNKLEKAMADAGYTFDFEKKELKKIEPKTAAWTPMDEQRVENLLAIIEGHGYPGEVEWLNSLKDRVQSKQEWSEEDRKMFVNIKACLRNANKDYSREVDWLKSLRPYNRYRPSDEQIKVCKEVYADILSAEGFDLGTVNSELNRLEEELKKIRNE